MTDLGFEINGLRFAIKEGKYSNKEEYKTFSQDRNQYIKYNNKENELVSLFKSDIERVFNIQDNSKKDKLWNIAWERGHSSGYLEIINEYIDLVELIK